MATVTILASGYTGNSTLTISDINNAYTDTSSTNYANLAVSSGGGTGGIYFTFDTSSIPQNVRINSVNAKVKYSVSSTTYLTALTCQAYSGTTAMGSKITNRSTSGTVYTLSVGTWSREELNNFRIYFTGRRGILGSAAMRVYGMELTVDYTVLVSQTVNTSITGGVLYSPKPVESVYLGDSITYSFSPEIGKQFSSMTINGTTITPTAESIAPVSNGVALFRLNSNLIDSFGNASTANVGSATEFVDGRFGKGIYFSGNNGLQINLPKEYSPVTIEFWFYTNQPNTSGIYPTLFSTSSGNSSGGTYCTVDDSTYSTFMVCRANARTGSNNTGGYGNTVVTRGEWHHFAYTRSGNSHYYYLDGKHQYTVSQSSPNSNQTIYIGVRRTSSSYDCYFTGIIDDILISSTAKWTGTAGFTPPKAPYSTETTQVYSYSMEVNGDINTNIIFTDKPEVLFVQKNGNVVEVQEVYKKINGTWVLQQLGTYSTVFDTGTNYVAG